MKQLLKRQDLINYLIGMSTPDEKRKIEAWLDKEPVNIKRLQQVADELRVNNSLTIDTAAVKQNVLRHIEENEKQKQKRVSTLLSKHKSRRFGGQQPAHDYSGSGRWLKVAAMVLVIITAGLAGFYFSAQYVFEDEEQVALQSRSLSNGQTATLRFGDGSVIQLNGGSTLRYPEEFSNERRVVYLKGEAFFEIARDESRPFIVHTPEATVRVLGTSFNIEAYSGDQTVTVTVAEGMVAVSPESPGKGAKPGNDSIVLEKQQWASFNVQGELVGQGEGNIWAKIAWKEDVIVFNNETLEETARMLERWYGVEISIQNEDLKQIVLQGEHKDASLEAVLQSIQYITGMEYSIEGDSVIIY